MRGIFIKRLLFTLSILLILFVVYLFSPIFVAPPSKSNPISSFEEAVAMITAIQNNEDSSIATECKTRLLQHAKKTQKVVVIFHGFTNCPKQFELLAQQLFDLGYTVYTPRIPHHGLADTMTTDLDKTTVEQLTSVTDSSINLAHGLGERITVVGLSGGGSMAAWAAQNREDVEKALLIAPFFGYYQTPLWIMSPAIHLAPLIPNQFVWWDKQLQKDIVGPKYAYPRFSIRAIGQFMFLGAATQLQAVWEKPKAKKIVFVTTASDIAIKKELVDELKTLWLRSSPKTVSQYEFPADVISIHDIIDPNQTKQNVKRVYPKIIELIISD